MTNEEREHLRIVGHNATPFIMEPFQGSRLQREREQSRIRGHRWWSQLSNEQRQLRREQQRNAYRRRQDRKFGIQSESQSCQHRQNLLLHRHYGSQQQSNEVQCIQTVQPGTNMKLMGRIRIRDIRRQARQIHTTTISNSVRNLPGGDNCDDTSRTPLIDLRSGCTIHQGRTRLTKLRHQARLSENLSNQSYHYVAQDRNDVTQIAGAHCRRHNHEELFVTHHEVQDDQPTEGP